MTLAALWATLDQRQKRQHLLTAGIKLRATKTERRLTGNLDAVFGFGFPGDRDSRSRRGVIVASATAAVLAGRQQSASRLLCRGHADAEAGGSWLGNRTARRRGMSRLNEDGSLAEPYHRRSDDTGRFEADPFVAPPSDEHPFSSREAREYVRWLSFLTPCERCGACAADGDAVRLVYRRPTLAQRQQFKVSQVKDWPAWRRTLESINSEIDKCEIVCQLCNRAYPRPMTSIGLAA